MVHFILKFRWPAAALWNLIEQILTVVTGRKMYSNSSSGCSGAERGIKVTENDSNNGDNNRVCNTIVKAR